MMIAVPLSFWENYTPEPNSGCWLWTGSALRRGGYGRIGIARKTYLAHRLAFQLSVGPIPTGMIVCHRCDTPLCVNPDHLFAGTPADNVHDMIRKCRNRGPHRNKSACKHGHPFTPGNTIMRIRSNGPERMCRACMNVTTRAIHRRKAEARRVFERVALQMS